MNGFGEEKSAVRGKLGARIDGGGEIGLFGAVKRIADDGAGGEIVEALLVLLVAEEVLVGPGGGLGSGRLLDGGSGRQLFLLDIGLGVKTFHGVDGPLVGGPGVDIAQDGR